MFSGCSLSSCYDSCTSEEETKSMDEERIGGTAETMLQELYARARESERAHHRIWDPKAVETVRRMRHEFTETDHDTEMSSEVMARTIVLDQMVSEYIRKNPEAILINIACGMDTRFYRVDNGKITWYNVDLPVTMALRAEYIQEDKRVVNITASAMEDEWTKYVRNTGQPVLIIAEGFSMYLTEKDIRQILSVISHHFSDVTVFMEFMNPRFVKKKTDASAWHSDTAFTWGIRSGKELVALCPAFHWIEDRSIVEGMEQISLVYKVIGKIGLFRDLSDKIAVIRK